jgi:hypothetical protein
VDHSPGQGDAVEGLEERVGVVGEQAHRLAGPKPGRPEASRQTLRALGEGREREAALAVHDRGLGGEEPPGASEEVERGQGSPHGYCSDR